MKHLIKVYLLLSIVFISCTCNSCFWERKVRLEYYLVDNSNIEEKLNFIDNFFVRLNENSDNNYKHASIQYWYYSQKAFFDLDEIRNSVQNNDSLLWKVDYIKAFGLYVLGFIDLAIELQLELLNNSSINQEIMRSELAMSFAKLADYKKAVYYYEQISISQNKDKLKIIKQLDMLSSYYYRNNEYIKTISTLKRLYKEREREYTFTDSFSSFISSYGLLGLQDSVKYYLDKYKNEIDKEYLSLASKIETVQDWEEYKKESDSYFLNKYLLIPEKNRLQKLYYPMSKYFVNSWFNTIFNFNVYEKSNINFSFILYKNKPSLAIQSNSIKIQDIMNELIDDLPDSESNQVELDLNHRFIKISRNDNIFYVLTSENKE
jgi:hypothetical protein